MCRHLDGNLFIQRRSDLVTNSLPDMRELCVRRRRFMEIRGGLDSPTGSGFCDYEY